MRLVWVVILFLWGINSLQAEESVKNYIERIRKTTKKGIQKLTPMEVFVPNKYKGKEIIRDPFSLAEEFIDKLKEEETVEDVLVEEDYMQFKQQPRPDKNREKEYLENFPLDNFTVVGSINKGNLLWVLLKDVKGRLFHLKKGNYLGYNSGKIEKIVKQGIYLQEIVADGQGGWRKRKVFIRINDEKAGAEE